MNWRKSSKTFRSKYLKWRSPRHRSLTHSCLQTNKSNSDNSSNFNSSSCFRRCRARVLSFLKKTTNTLHLLLLSIQPIAHQVVYPRWVSLTRRAGFRSKRLWLRGRMEISRLKVEWATSTKQAATLIKVFTRWTRQILLGSSHAPLVKTIR